MALISFQMSHTRPLETTIRSLPAEIIDFIFRILDPSVSEVCELSCVSHQFREACKRVKIKTRIPLSEEQLTLIKILRTPVIKLYCDQPAMFVNDQIFSLNLRCLKAAELCSNDYEAANKRILSAAYVRMLSFLSETCGQAMKSLVVNLDLARERWTGQFRCVNILTKFANLTLLSICFNTGIEFEQKVTHSNHGCEVIERIVAGLKHLEILQIRHCPTERLVLRSESLLVLSLFQAEFADFQELATPNLCHLRIWQVKTFMMENTSDISVADQCDKLFRTLHQGCPNLKTLNNIPLGMTRTELKEGNEQWKNIILGLFDS